MPGTDKNFDRRPNFIPTPRPAWVKILNDIGGGIDIKNIVPLTAQSLIEAAVANTGLNDFGEDDWQEPFARLTRAIDGEAMLHLAGRLLTRAQLLVFLEARLQVVDWYRRHPEVDDEIVDRPVLITGFGRSGTTILFEVLSQDPQFRVVQRWEAMYPVPPPQAETYKTDLRIEKTERLFRLLAEMLPEFGGVHKIGGDLPIESLEFEYQTFCSEVFPMLMHVPSYAAFIAEMDLTKTFGWHKKLLKLLQSRYMLKHWLMKSPSHLWNLENYLKVFPDLRIVFSHRDPIATADSVTSFMGMLYYQRTDEVWGDGGIESPALAMGAERAKIWDPVIEMIEDGRIAKGNYANFYYDRFLVDPIAAVQSVYDDLGMTLTAEAAERMRSYLEKKTQGKFGKHEYEQAPANIVDEERSIYARYQRFFAVPNEL